MCFFNRRFPEVEHFDVAVFGAGDQDRGVWMKFEAGDLFGMIV